MADVRSVEIRIISEDSGKGDNQAKKPVDENGQLKTDLNALMHPIHTAERNLLGKNILVMQAYQNAKSVVTQTVRFEIGRNMSLKENYLGENTYNNAMKSVSKVASAGTSIIGSAVAGASLGPAGAVAGAIIGAVTWGVGEVEGYRDRMSGYYQSLNSSNIGRDFARVRAGLVDGGKGTEN